MSNFYVLRALLVEIYQENRLFDTRIFDIEHNFQK